MKLRDIARSRFLNTTWGRAFAPRYPYMFTPRQLAFMLDCLDQVVAVEGCMVEVGCASGWTTVFLNQHLLHTGQTRRYVAIDTFTGFLPVDVDLEVDRRGKDRGQYTGFARNHRDWFDTATGRFANVEGHQADASSFDYGSLGGVAFALVDVDLYRPVLNSLRGLLAVMQPGGIIVVDDCKPEGNFDGALEAYSEIAEEIGHAPEIVHDKLGVLRFQPPTGPSSST